MTLDAVGIKLDCVGEGVEIGEKVASGLGAVPCGDDVREERTLGEEGILGSGSLAASSLSSTIFNGTDCDILSVSLTYSSGIKLRLKQKILSLRILSNKQEKLINFNSTSFFI